MTINRPVLSLALAGTGAVQYEPESSTTKLGRATVVIPCYNYGRYLSDAVAAALDQPGLDMDVIVVDDCSTDGTGDVAADLAENASRVSVIQHAHNLGHIATYNDGLSSATGEFVALVSADDLLTRGSLSRSAALMRSHADVGFVYGRTVHFKGNVPKPRTKTQAWITWPGERWIEARCRAGYNAIASPEVLMRTAVVQ